MTLSDRLRSSPFGYRIPGRRRRRGRASDRAGRVPKRVPRRINLQKYARSLPISFAGRLTHAIATAYWAGIFMSPLFGVLPTSPRPSHLHDLFVQVDAGVCTGTLPNAKRHRAQVEEAIQATLRADQEASAPLAACPSVPSTPVRTFPPHAPPRHFGVTFGITRSVPTGPDHLSGARRGLSPCGVRAVMGCTIINPQREVGFCESRAE